MRIIDLALELKSTWLEEELLHKRTPSAANRITTGASANVE